ncbi:hypothetical protein [Massilia orientalis]|uniref:Uncharacterized protein n=1 Tax=Massilia orientalis TaxID=3050128 RepID=A0ACC7ML61_9BURK|nr:hypothetical protein [Massilia sp. YIM B02787]
MNNFGVFDDFRVCAWISEGLINAANDVVKVVKSTAARAGAVAAFAVASTAATVSFAPEAKADNHLAFVHVVPTEQTALQGTRAVLPTMDGELTQLKTEIADSLRNRHNISEASFDASTIEKAQLALERINLNMPVFSQEWMDQITSGKA